MTNKKYLSNGPRDYERCVFRVRKNAFSRVVETKEGCTVNNDTLNGNAKTSVETTKTITFKDLN